MYVPQKVLCHCAEVTKDFRCCNHRLCFLQYDWQLENSLKQSMLMKPKESAKRHQILSSRVGSGLETTNMGQEISIEDECGFRPDRKYTCGECGKDETSFYWTLLHSVPLYHGCTWVYWTLLAGREILGLK